MRIVVLKETDLQEKRVALTPDIVKKFIQSGHEIVVEKEAGLRATFSDKDYTEAGAAIASSSQLFKDQAIYLKVSSINEPWFDKMPSDSVVMGIFKPHLNEAVLSKMASKNLTSLGLELIPRISRAQSMDVLSSQSSLAGYRAVVECAHVFGRAFPLMMTPSGTIPAAKVLILGVGVAGLQAIATAKRLGAVVSAFDVRSVVKEQVESLGAKFINVDYDETGDSVGGYAKEMSAGYKKAQKEKLALTIKAHDIVITTAQIPFKKAPLLISKEMVRSMKPGSVIFDLAAESGGNCELSKCNEITEENGVKILASNYPLSGISRDASFMYARNVWSLSQLLLKDKTVNLEDEIIQSTLLTHNGKVKFKLSS